jgi:chorismate dehydratase
LIAKKARVDSLAFFVKNGKEMTLRVGQIAYANCTPLFTALKRNFNCEGYRFVNGVPAALNVMLSRSEIDLCPSSSFEYAKSPDKYYLLPGLSISSIGAVKSVLLFSRYPIEKLDRHSIGLTTESDTSVNLLKIVLRKGYGLTNHFQRSTLALNDALNSFGAFLLIGDAALKLAMEAKGVHVYDLGALWYELTGLPFVFALWIVTRDAVETKIGEVRSLGEVLLKAKKLAYESYVEIAASSRELEWIGQDTLVDYWRTISYDLTQRHIEGARLFFRMAKELDLLEFAPDLRFVDGVSE